MVPTLKAVHAAVRHAQVSSWWVVDLGAAHRLIVNFYTLRHDGSADFLRNWVLQVWRFRICRRLTHKLRGCEDGWVEV